jgi:hypothetical protein
MPHRPLKPGSVLLGALVLALAACSDNGNGPADGSNLLTTAQVQDLGQDMAEDVVELTDASVFDGSTGLNMEGATSNGVRLASVPPPCITVSPTPPTNSDSDIVPDSVRLTYDCGFQRANGVLIDSLTGSIDFFDPQPTVVSLGVKHIFNDFTRKRINTAFPLRSFTAVHNGAREWGGNTDTLGHTITNFTTVWTHVSGRQTTHVKDWIARFTATTPGTIGLGIPLPAGGIDLNGTSTWSTANRSWSVAVTTVEALQYDPSCQVTPRLTSGTLDLVVTRNGEVTNVEIVFTACGQYQVTKTVGATS